MLILLMIKLIILIIIIIMMPRDRLYSCEAVELVSLRLIIHLDLASDHVD